MEEGKKRKRWDRRWKQCVRERKMTLGMENI